jgi:hypothetical protein
VNLLSMKAIPSPNHDAGQVSISAHLHIPNCAILKFVSSPKGCSVTPPGRYPDSWMAQRLCSHLRHARLRNVLSSRLPSRFNTTGAPRLLLLEINNGTYSISPPDNCLPALTLFSTSPAPKRHPHLLAFGPQGMTGPSRCFQLRFNPSSYFRKPISHAADRL